MPMYKSGGMKQEDRMFQASLDCENKSRKEGTGLENTEAAEHVEAFRK